MNRLVQISILLFSVIQISNAQLVINELSQGPSGSKEYVEFLVIGNPTCSSSTVDIRGWVFDDNNSWHAPGAGNGIAFGHKRFSNAAQWATVRMGSIIVVYNDADLNAAMPADDETDSNHDCVYILPGTSSLLDHNITVPTGGLIFTTYAAAPYTSAGNWSTLSMNNTNDAFHTVNPLAITRPYHAIGWGTNIDSNTVYYSGGMSNRSVRFMNTIDNNPFNPANFSRDTVLLGGTIESPGLANSLANAAYINYMKNSCLPFTAFTIVKDTATCSGNFIFAGGGLQSATGSYYDTIRGLGCDTILRTNLTVLPIPIMAQTISICFGETAIIAGIPRTIPNVYRDTLLSVTGCDSIVNTTLIIDSIKTFSQNIALCPGDRFFAGGSFQSTAGTFFDTIVSVFGCDSVLTTIITMRVVSSSSSSITRCTGDPCPTWGPNVCCLPGIYYDTLANYLGCDSIASLAVFAGNRHDSTFSKTICSGEFVRIGLVNHSVGGISQDTLASTTGCDSIVTLNLTVNPISSKIIDTTLCQGFSIRIGTITHNTSGTFFDTLSNYLACDSIVRTNLTILNLSNSRAITICSNDSIFLAGAFRKTPGIYYDTLTGRLGCDSVLRTNLSVIPPMTTLSSEILCSGTPYLGFIYLRDTSWSSTNINRFGCDSTHSVMLTINPIPLISSRSDTCITAGESLIISANGGLTYEWNTGATASAITVAPAITSTYIVQGFNVQGCFAFDTIVVCVNPYSDSSYFAIPNAFSPNGDGLNDLFKVLATYNLSLENMQIFNRWGELVYNSDNILKGWDGTFKERQQPIGSFVYFITLRNTISNKTESHTGTLTLIR